MNKLKVTDLKTGFQIFGNKGNLWNKNAHIFEVGFNPNTLCGTPMLSNNHCKNELYIGCEECLAIYESLNSDKSESLDINSKT